MIEPRYRIYTTPRSYLTVAAGLLTGKQRFTDKTAALQSAMSALTGSAFTLPMPQCRVGIYHAVKHLVPPGKKILLSPYTLTDVINMVICAGAVPVFVYIDRATCNISPQAIAAAIDSDTAAVLVTHLHGLCCSQICLMAGISQQRPCK